MRLQQQALHLVEVFTFCCDSIPKQNTSSVQALTSSGIPSPINQGRLLTIETTKLVYFHKRLETKVNA